MDVDIMDFMDQDLLIVGPCWWGFWSQIPRARVTPFSVRQGENMKMKEVQWKTENVYGDSSQTN